MVIPIVKFDVVNDFLTDDEMRFTVFSNNGIITYSNGCPNDLFIYTELGLYDGSIVNTCNFCD